MHLSEDDADAWKHVGVKTKINQQNAQINSGLIYY